ncbi:hypothetical protein FACS1894180_4550 [Bacteroidia bacterium]|nr:hypothetical protein FACS1894180_4550 [Bacteroidia bacterium]
MKRNITYLLTVALCIACSCSKKKSTTTAETKPVTDTATGVFFEFPFIQSTEYLFACENNSVRLDKVLTKDDIIYNLSANGAKKSIKIPIYREVSDYYPHLLPKLDSVIEKNYFLTPKNAFVVEFYYGSACIQWNYLYEIKDTAIYLKDVFYIEPYNDMGLSETDTLYYLYHFEVFNKDDKFIDSLYNHFEYIKNKNEKWDLETKKIIRNG